MGEKHGIGVLDGFAGFCSGGLVGRSPSPFFLAVCFSSFLSHFLPFLWSFKLACSDQMLLPLPFPFDCLACETSALQLHMGRPCGIAFGGGSVDRNLAAA